ncbi:hypothetical protein BVSY1_34160 [Bacillus velezensis]|nr:hypothetical protein BVSY1_34160 [Bacillus velezensis]
MAGAREKHTEFDFFFLCHDGSPSILKYGSENINSTKPIFPSNFIRINQNVQLSRKFVNALRQKS